MTFEEFYLKYKDNIYRYIFVILNNSTESEEITSKVFLTAFKKYESFKNYDNPQFWLIKTARNFISNLFRKNKILNLEDLKNSEDENILIQEIISDKDELTPDQQILLDEIKDEIQTALQQLNPIFREIIILKIWEQFNYEQIAELLDRPSTTVKKYYFRAIKKLYEILTKDKENRKGMLLVVSVLAVDNTKYNSDYKTNLQFDINKFKDLPIEDSIVSSNFFNNHKIFNFFNFNLMNNLKNLMLGMIGGLLLICGLVSGIFGTYYFIKKMIVKAIKIKMSKNLKLQYKLKQQV